MPYLTNDEYLDRFGEIETVRLTDEDRTGDVDSAKLEEAIADAGEEVDSYLANQYSTPLSSPPRLVKGFVAILARALLYKTTAPQAVKDDAERVRAQLRDLAKGVTKLPGETGPVEPDARASAMSSTSGDYVGPVFSDEALAGFSVPNGGCVARWRS